MNDSETSAPQAPKPSRLSGLVAPKGAAARPGEAHASTPAGPASARSEPKAAPQPAPPIGTGSKSLTLRLPDAEYERLRSHAFASRKTHQTILAEALRRYLDDAEAS